jgi:hypothetical protein
MLQALIKMDTCSSDTSVPANHGVASQTSSITRTLSLRYAKHNNNVVTFQLSSSLHNRIPCTGSLERYGTRRCPVLPILSSDGHSLLASFFQNTSVCYHFSNLALFNPEDTSSILFLM